MDDPAESAAAILEARKLLNSVPPPAGRDASDPPVGLGAGAVAAGRCAHRRRRAGERIAAPGLLVYAAIAALLAHRGHRVLRVAVSQRSTARRGCTHGRVVRRARVAARREPRRDALCTRRRPIEDRAALVALELQRLAKEQQRLRRELPWS